jgi:hypothetical protein
MKDKEVFQFDKLDCEKLATSLGLANAPQINFVKKSSDKNASRSKDLEDSDEAKAPGQEEGKKVSRLQRLKDKIKEKKELKRKQEEELA